MADPTITEFTAELRLATNALREFIKAQTDQINKLQGNIDTVNDSVDDTIEAYKEHVKALTSNKTLTDAQNKKLEKVNKQLELASKLEKELNKLKDEENRITASSNKTQADLDDITKRRIATEMKLEDARNDARTSVNELDNSMGKLNTKTNVAGASLRWFGETVMSQGRQLAKQYKASGGIIEGSGTILETFTKQQIDGLTKYGGVTGEFVQSLTREHRQVFNAMGGSAKALNELNPAIKRLRILTGDSELGLKEAAAAAQSFALKGIKPSNAVIQQYTGDLVQLGKYTGMQVTQAREYYDAVAEDTDSIIILRSAREDERQSILANQRALINQSLALGMSAKQAQEAAKMLNKMVAAKPLERIKQAAKIRALGGALGIAGAEGAAQAVTAGKRATSEQKAALQQFSQSAANAMDQAAGKGLGSEIFATTLVEKLDLDQYYGTNSEFSTTLASANKPVVDAINALHEPTGKEAEMINALAIANAGIAATLSGQNILGTATAGLAAAVTTLASVVGAGKIGDLIKGGGIGRAGGALGTATKWGGRLLKGAGIAGAVGMAGEYGGEALEKSGHSQLGAGAKIAGAVGTGAALGSILGPAGTLVGGALGAGYGLYQNWGQLTGGNTSAPPAQLQPMTPQQRQAATTNNATPGDDEARLAVLNTSTGITQQLKQMDQSNMLLKQLADLSQKQVDLSEKQLIALTLTDKEKDNATNRSNLRRDNKFGAQYSYV